MRASSVRATAHAFARSGHQPDQSNPTNASPKHGVRKPSILRDALSAKVRAHGPAHPSNRLVAQLNGHWRVVDDPLQWILQRKKGNPRNKNPGWRDRSFCRTQEALLRCVREYCCSPDKGGVRCIHEYHGVDRAALRQVRALPERHLDWRSPPDVAGGNDAPALIFAADEMPQ